VWWPGKRVSIDEMDIPFKGSHSGKERITYKKAGDGFLIYALSDSNGNVFSTSIKCDNQRKNQAGLSPIFSALYSLAVRLPQQNKYHHVFADNLYGQVNLAEKLWEKNILFTSTARENRVPKLVNIPSSSAHNTFKILKRNHAMVICWMDRKLVRFITTAHCHLEIVNAIRKRPVWSPEDDRFVHLPTPVPVLNVANDYNNFMDGVDLSDQLRHYYPVRLRSRKWWCALFWWIVHTAANNAYLMFQANCRATQTMDHLAFHRKLAGELVGESDILGADARQSKGSKRQRAMVAEPTYAEGHMPIPVPRDHRGFPLDWDCVNCKAKSHVRVRTSIQCSTCNVGLCLNCYRDFHTCK
jgi:hypothetical protein